jgi:hypothetical protein
MEIINRKTAAMDRDPFAQSDRNSFGHHAGKGDSPRNVGNNFKANFDDIRWSPRGKRKPGRTTYRY